MNGAEQIKVSMSDYPALDVEIFVRGIVAAAKRYYEDPVHEANYRAWLASRGRYEDENGVVRMLNEMEASANG